MFTSIFLLRYIVYIACATLVHHLFPQFSIEFLLICGVLAEVLDWKYNQPEQEDDPSGKLYS